MIYILKCCSILLMSFSSFLDSQIEQYVTEEVDKRIKDRYSDIEGQIHDLQHRKSELIDELEKLRNQISVAREMLNNLKASLHTMDNT